MDIQASNTAQPHDPYETSLHQNTVHQRPQHQKFRKCFSKLSGDSLVTIVFCSPNRSTFSAKIPARFRLISLETKKSFLIHIACQMGCFPTRSCTKIQHTISRFRWQLHHVHCTRLGYKLAHFGDQLFSTYSSIVAKLTV